MICRSKVKAAIINSTVFLICFYSISFSQNDPFPKWTHYSIDPILPGSSWGTGGPVLADYDLDGDLGENDPNVTNLFITDSRNNVTYNYRISQLAPDGANIHIKGNLNAVIKNTAITDGSSSQSVTYSLYIKDRAGNTSNSITTSAITITK